MKPPWFNEENPHFDNEKFQVSAQHTPVQRVIIAIFVIIFFPIKCL